MVNKINKNWNQNSIEELKGYYGAIEPKGFPWVWAEEINIDLIEDCTNNYWTNKISYCQLYINNSMCTIISAVGILSNYFNYKFSKEELLELVDLARKENPPFRDGVWWYVNLWAHLVMRYWNKKSDEKVNMYTVCVGSQLFRKLLKKGYHCEVWFRGNRLFTKDKHDNCAIDTVEKVNNPTYGHAVYLWYKDWKVYTIDSYNCYSCNVYEVSNFNKLIKNRVYFKYAYFFIPKKNIMTPLQKDIELVEKAYKEWITHNYDNVKNIRKGIYTQDVKTILIVMRAMEKIKEYIDKNKGK